MKNFIKKIICLFFGHKWKILQQKTKYTKKN